MTDDLVSQWDVSSPHRRMSSLAKELEKLLPGAARFARHFQCVEYDWKDGPPLAGFFVYPGFQHGTPDIDGLVAFLDSVLVNYCIPRSEIAALHASHASPQGRDELDELREAMSSLKDRARRSFIRAKKELKTGGEAGEVILFALLERLLKAPQLVSKMNLKTNGNQPNFGRDGVHVGYDAASRSLILFMGESKLEKQFSKAADHAMESVLGYLDDLVLRDHEIDVVRSHADLGDMQEEAQAALRQLLNPYAGAPPQAGVVHACLLGFEAAEFGAVASKPPGDVEAAFKAAYLKRVATGCKLVKGKADKVLPVGTRMIFFLLPFPCLETLRSTFLQKIGAVPTP